MAIAISCYIRTKNEGRNIARAVIAARRVASEVVVVDSGSTDATVELALEAGARVVEAPWRGWGRQKRIGEDACTHDWVLDLDADEIVSEALAAEIQDLFAQGEPPSRVYEMKMATIPPVGRPWLTFNLVDRRKLYDRRVVRQPDHEVWDQFKTPPGLKVGKLNALLLHYSFADLDELNTKFTRQTDISARASKRALWLIRLRALLGWQFYFWNQYVRRGLWRAGWYGFLVARIAAHGRWLKDARMLESRLRVDDLSRLGARPWTDAREPVLAESDEDRAVASARLATITGERSRQFDRRPVSIELEENPQAAEASPLARRFQ
jgi:glycosyltransferase involved in cell wall biosynthesis